MKYIKNSLIYTAYLYASSLIGYSVNMLIDIIVRTVAAMKTPYDNAALISTLIVMNIIPWIVLLIIMYRKGYRENNGYEKVSWDFLCTITGMSFLISILINIIFDFGFILDMRGTINTPYLASLIEMAMYEAQNVNAEVLPTYVDITLSWGTMLLSLTIQLLLCVPSILGGYYLGYRKRIRDRYEIMNGEKT